MEEAPGLLYLTVDGERKGAHFDRKERAWEHLTSIAECSLCVPLSHWYFVAMQSTRAPHSKADDVIEVLSLQAADDAMLGQGGSHACLRKYYSGSNNAEEVSVCILCKKRRKEKSNGGNFREDK